MTLIAPSLLAADFTELKKACDIINESKADWFHLDVMDGHFVPNITFGPIIVESINRMCDKPLDVHLMIEEPDRYIPEFAKAGADIISVHLETCKHLHRTINFIKEQGCAASVAINPHTPAESLKDVLEDLDMICVMSVNPGFGGQKFIYRTLHKLRTLREMVRVRNLSVKIEVDGGVGDQNAEQIVKAGADVLVAGTSVFKSDDPSKAISRLKSTAQNFARA